MRILLSTMSLMVVVCAVAAPPGSAASPPPFTVPPTDCPAGVPLAPGDIATIAGGGNEFGDGGQALDAAVDVTVGGVAVDASGTVLVSGAYGQGVRRIGADGLVGTIAGVVDGAPLRGLGALDITTDGALVLADGGDGQILEVSTDGTVAIIAGPEKAASPNSGPIARAGLPSHVTIGPDGSIYFDDDAAIRVVRPDGTIAAFAGTGDPGFSGDGGPATAAQLGGIDKGDESYKDVEGTVVAPDGTLYIADTGNQRVRKVDSAGTITTVAGSGVRGYSGDGGSALEATFQDPVDLALDDAGNLYISDHHNDAVRKVDSAGIITTVAGKGSLGVLGDCGSATAASIGPWPIAIQDGYLYIGDMHNGRIRVVKL